MGAKKHNKKAYPVRTPPKWNQSGFRPAYECSRLQSVNSPAVPLAEQQRLVKVALEKTEEEIRKSAKRCKEIKTRTERAERNFKDELEVWKYITTQAGVFETEWLEENSDRAIKKNGRQCSVGKKIRSNIWGNIFHVAKEILQDFAQHSYLRQVYDDEEDDVMQLKQFFVSNQRKLLNKDDPQLMMVLRETQSLYTTIVRLGKEMQGQGSNPKSGLKSALIHGQTSKGKTIETYLQDIKAARESTEKKKKDRQEIKEHLIKTEKAYDDINLDRISLDKEYTHKLNSSEEFINLKSEIRSLRMNIQTRIHRLGEMKGTIYQNVVGTTDIDSRLKELRVIEDMKEKKNELICSLQEKLNRLHKSQATLRWLEEEVIEGEAFVEENDRKLKSLDDAIYQQSKTIALYNNRMESLRQGKKYEYFMLYPQFDYKENATFPQNTTWEQK